MKNLLLSWLHFGLMTFYVVSGFFFSLPVVLIAYLLIELHLIVFNGCLFTLWQRKAGGLNGNQDFIPYYWQKFLRRQLTRRQSDFISYAIIIFPLVIGILKYYL